MGRLIKWIGIAIGFLVVVAIVALVGLYMVLLRGMPLNDGTLQISALSAPVEIVRDRHAVPHIQGANERDVVAALGFVHAQERLWQMEVLRMAAQGRLSEMFGDAAISADKFLRTIAIDRAAERSVVALLPETRDLLEAYSGGVNAYLTRKKRLFEPALPPEFMILGHMPEPWQPQHSVAAIKMMALTLGQNSGVELRRMGLAARGFSPIEIEELIPNHRGDNPPPLPDLRQLFNIGEDGPRASAPIEKADRVLEALIGETGVWASNNWVISGARTRTGKPILANDPHLGISAPATFFLAHLAYDENGKTRHVIGASLPGTPAIMVGRTDRLAWGLTTTGLDAQDIYVERLSADDDNMYETPQGVQPFEVREEHIAVKGADPVIIKVRRTRHGPVLPDSYRQISTILPERTVAALQWVALASDDTTLDAVFKIPDAENVDDYIAAMARVVSPMQSMVIADQDGNIAMIAPGRVPVRSAENTIMGRAPVPGWEAKYDWQGYLRPDQVPILKNPPNGAIGTANSRILWPGYSHHITFDWAEVYRHDRVQELIVQNPAKQDMETSVAAMGDTRSGAYLELRDILFELIGPGVTVNREITTALRRWDGEMAFAAPEPLIMAAWLKIMYRRVLEDDLKDQYSRFERVNATRLIQLLDHAVARDWCDVITTEIKETCGTLAKVALQDALDELERDYGKDWRKWRWGETHIAYGEHRPFANVGLLAGLFNIEIGSAGGAYTLRRGQIELSGERPYHNVHGSVYRAVYDLADPDRSKFIIFGGQSGHFLSAHYRSLAEKWSQMAFISMTTKSSEYAVGAIGTLRLTPGNN